MAPDRRISIGGVEDKPIHWRCPRHRIEAEAVHPVQMVHLHIGQETNHDGKLFRIVHLDMIGAELMVYREVVTSAQRGKARDV